MKLLPKRDGELVEIGSRLQPRVTGIVRPVDAHPLARRRRAEVDGMIALPPRPPSRRRGTAIDCALDFRDSVDDDGILLDRIRVVKIPVAEQVQIPLFNFPLLRLPKRQAAREKKRNGNEEFHGEGGFNKQESLFVQRP